MQTNTYNVKQLQYRVMFIYLFIYLFFVFRQPVAVLVVWQCPSAHLLPVLFMHFIIAGS